MARKAGIEGRCCPPKAVVLVVAERQLEDPLAAVIRSRSGGGNSVIAGRIERLTSSEDVTRLTSQRLEPVFLDRRLVIVEEPCSSAEAGWTIRVLSR